MSAEHLYLEKTKDRDPLRKCNKILNSRNSYEKNKNVYLLQETIYDSKYYSIANMFKTNS